MVNGVPLEVQRHSIHHDTPKAFPYDVIFSESRTSKEGFLSANRLPGTETVSKKQKRKVIPT